MMKKPRRGRLIFLGGVAITVAMTSGCSPRNPYPHGLPPNNPTHTTFKQFQTMSPAQKEEYLQKLRQAQPKL